MNDPSRPFPIRVFPGPADIARAARDEFLRRAADAIGRNGRFNVALSGGSTPKRLFRELAEVDRSGEPIRWRSIHLFWGDERPVLPDHPDSNFGTARELLLSRIAIPAENVHRIRAELGPGEAAAAYERELRDSFGIGADETPRFDLILLGMGKDGHTASLFPGTGALRETGRLVVANRVGSHRTVRITMTYPVLNGADCVLFLVAGADKAERLREILEGDARPEELPAQAVRPATGELLWFVDAAAATRLQAQADLSG